jgi:hypothetical protein
MDDYNFWSDLLDTWQSTADWIKALAILAPQASALAALALVLRHRRARRRAEPLPAGTLAYTIWRDDDDRLHVMRHVPERRREFALPSDPDGDGKRAWGSPAL